VPIQTLADAAILIRADFTQAKASAKAQAKEVGETAGREAGETFSDHFGKSISDGSGKLKSVIGKVAGLFAVGFGAGAVVKFGLQTAASLQQAQIGFTTMLGSAQKSAAFLKQLQHFAAVTPFNLSGLEESSRTLLGVGVSAKNVIPILTAYGDAAGALGIQQDAFQRIMIAVSQSLSAGKIKLGDMNQLMNNGLPIWKLMSEAMGKPVPQLQKMISQGKLLSADVLPKLQKQMEKDYGGAMAKQGQTLSGVWSTLQDTISIGLGNALTPLVPLLSKLVPAAAAVLGKGLTWLSTLFAALIGGFEGGQKKLSGFASTVQGIGQKIGGVVGAITGSSKEVSASVEPYAKLGEEIHNEVLPAHVELAKGLLTEVVPALVKLALQIATIAIPIMYKLEEVIKGAIVPALLTVTTFFEQHKKVITDVALVYAGLIAANKAWEAVELVSKNVQLAYNSAIKLSEGLMKTYTLATKGAAGATKAYAATVALSRGYLATWIGVKAIEIREFFASAVAADGNTAAIIAQAAATKIAAAATKIWVGIQTAFNAVMDLNPIGLTVIALAALTAGVIYAYTHFAWFRDVVQVTWKAIQVATAATVNWFVHTVWPDLQKVWNGIASGALWLWHNAIEPVWHGIQDVISVVVAVVRGYIQGLIVEWHIMATVATWLYNNIIGPIFHAIARIIQASMAVAQLAMKLIEVFILGPLGQAFVWLYDKIVKPVFGFIAGEIKAEIGAAITVLTAIRNYIVGELTKTFIGIKNEVQATWSAITGFFTHAWNVIKALLSALATYLTKNMSLAMTSFANATGIHWDAIKSKISSVWNAIKGVFNALVGWVTRTIPGAFASAVGAVGKAWTKIQDIVKAPITFTVNRVINPLINGFDRVAKAFGTSTIPPIAGFAEGGQIPGTPSATDNKWSWLRGKDGQILGTAGLATGEFVVNARDTAKALPLLRWVNEGMKGGAQNVARYLGRPVANEPGDGSEGWAFASGGLVGFLKDVWGAVSNPLKLIKKPVEDALSEIPGTGLVKDLVVGMGKKLLSGLLNFMTGSSSGAISGSVGAAQSFLRAQDGKPYIWASAGPQGYDCSGLVSAVYNIIKGKSIYNHTFSTESAAPYFPKPGYSGPLVAGWSHPGQAPASASVGHMMGMVGGLTFESTGGRGVHLGSTTRKVSDFANVGHFDRGGIVKLAQIARADFGSTVLERGNNLIFNGTGQREPLVSPNNSPARMHPDDIAALAQAIGGVVGGALLSTVPLTRVATRQMGSRR
jgi:tape measure domain-containing protein